MITTKKLKPEYDEELANMFMVKLLLLKIVNTYSILQSN